MANKYKDRWSFDEKHVIEHEVNGRICKFFPNRYTVLRDMAGMAKPISSSLMVLLDNGRETTAVTEDLKDGKMEIRKITVEAVRPEITAAKNKAREAAIDQLFELSSPMNRVLIGRCLMDSLREEFPYRQERPAKEVEEWLLGDGNGYEGIDLPTFTQLIAGWLKANAKVFGVQGEKLAGLVRSRVAALQSDSQFNEPTTPASGSSSQTASSPPSDTDSPSNSSND